MTGCLTLKGLEGNFYDNSDSDIDGGDGFDGCFAI